MALIRIIGLLSGICTMAYVLHKWISGHMEGHTYFTIGESSPLIRYLVWILLFLALIVACSYLKKELLE